MNFEQCCVIKAVLFFFLLALLCLVRSCSPGDFGFPQAWITVLNAAEWTGYLWWTSSPELVFQETIILSQNRPAG